MYKRAGVEDHPSLPRSLPSRPSSSRAAQLADKRQQDAAAQHAIERFQAFGSGGQSQTETEGSSSTTDVTTALGLSHSHHNINAYAAIPPPPTLSASLAPGPEEEDRLQLLHQHHSKQPCSLVPPACTTLLFTGPSSSLPSHAVDDLHRLVNYQQASMNQQQQYHNNNNPNQPSHQFSTLAVPQSSQALALNTLPAGSLQAAFSDRLWEYWNPIPEASRDYNSPFK